MKTNAETRFSDGTICDYYGNLILTKLGLSHMEYNKEFYCKECAKDYKRNCLKE